MAEKTLNTRILLKNATLTEWNQSTLILKAGEVALAKIETTQHDAATGNYYKVPTYLMKVGDGTKTFAQLNWLAAPASDVHTWAKKAALDYADLPETLRTEIDDLQAAMGTGGSVATQISAAITAAVEGLDSADAAVAKQFVTAVVQEDGKISVTRRELSADDIPTLAISKIDGLQAALDAKAALSDFNSVKTVVGDANSGLVKGLADEVANRTAADEELSGKIDVINNTTIPALSTRVDNNRDAAAEAARLAGVAQKEVDDLEGVVAALTQTVTDNKNAAETAVATEKSDREAADSALSDEIEALRTAIGNVSNIMNFRGAFATDAEVDTPVEGDVIVITSGDNKGKEFVYSAGEWVEFGSVDAQQTAIDDLLRRMTDAEGDITDLQTNSATKGELTAAQSALEDAIAKKANQTDLNNAVNRIGTLETVVGGDNDGLVKDVADLKATVGDANNGLVKNVADLQTASAKHAEKTWVEGEIQRVEGLVNDEKLRAEGAEQAIGKRIGDAEDAHDELAERVTIAEGEIDDLQDAVTRIEGTTIPTLATKATVEDIDNRLATIEGDYLRAADTYIFDCGNHTA